MTNEFNRDLMIAMLRKGSTGDEMLNILNVIVPDTDVEAVVSVEDAELVAVWVLRFVNSFISFSDERLRAE